MLIVCIQLAGAVGVYPEDLFEAQIIKEREKKNELMRAVKNHDFNVMLLQDSLKMLIYAKYPKSSGEKGSIYSSCIDFVNEMKQYRNNIDEYSKHVKGYCESMFNNSESPRSTLDMICQYIVDAITSDIKNELLPEYINEDLCNIFQ